jgi:hypothetical protein
VNEWKIMEISRFHEILIREGGRGGSLLIELRSWERWRREGVLASVDVGGNLSEK